MTVICVLAAVGAIAFIAVGVAVIALVLVRKKSRRNSQKNVNQLVIQNPINVHQVHRHVSEHHYSEIDGVDATYATLSPPVSTNQDDVFMNQ